ncbi:MAG: WecB/TagA/CpsF family glycosyltransferase [Pirellulales bacterium]
MTGNERRNLLGIQVSCVDYDKTLARVMEAAQARHPLAVSALAVHGVMTGVLDLEHRYRLNALDMLVPDGQPVRWALNWLHHAGLSDRVYGPTLMLRICEQASVEQLPIFLFGGTDDLLAALVNNLRKSFPELKIAGTRASLFRQLEPHERDELVHEIRDSGAAITFVGLGCPRQEIWAFELRDDLNMPVLAVGAAFNFHAGHLSQAPPFMQARGLEWLYRLTKEPIRLWKRYLLLNPLYVSLLLLQYTGLRRFDPTMSVKPEEEILCG